ncbi:hypothetical protein S40293_10772 [Stachybotrys chartarum IBT 40293]|nr:hypothetical protein S40293_10772 [Stachybotrys chartarum IBT 40293]
MASQSQPQDERESSTMSIVNFFSNDYSFQVQETCWERQRVDLDAACRIHFNSNGTVIQYGNETIPGTFEPNSDLAGLGVWWGLVSGLIVCILALLFVAREFFFLVKKFSRSYNKMRGRPGKANTSIAIAHVRKRNKLQVEYWAERWYAVFYPALRALIISTADVQAIVAVTYSIDFALQSKCSLSAYHYNVGINTILCSFVTTTLSVLIVRDYWRGALAPAFRFVIACAIFAILGRLLWYENSLASAPEATWSAKWPRVKGSNDDSTIFLPMACFLDPDLNPVIGLSPEQRERVGGDPGGVAPEFGIYWSMGVLFVIGHLSHLIRIRSRYREQKKLRLIRHFSHTAYYVVCLSYCIAIYVLLWVHINKIRSFVHQGRWIRGGNTDANAEHAIRGVGQILPITTTVGWIIFTGLDSIMFGARPKQEEGDK